MTAAEAHAWLCEMTRSFAQSPAGRRGEYTPHPATWLNGERYDDDPTEWQRDARAQPRTANGRPVADPRGTFAAMREYLRSHGVEVVSEMDGSEQ